MVLHNKVSFSIFPTFSSKRMFNLITGQYLWCAEYLGASVPISFWTDWATHMLNMELDLQSLFGLLCTAVLIGWNPASPPPPHLGSYTRALLVSQDRRHLFVTPWGNLFCKAFPIKTFCKMGQIVKDDLLTVPLVHYFIGHLLMFP
jgi:hypothetical protein